MGRFVDFLTCLFDGIMVKKEKGYDGVDDEEVAGFFRTKMKIY
jgi:hypothetical protein